MDEFLTHDTSFASRQAEWFPHIRVEEEEEEEEGSSYGFLTAEEELSDCWASFRRQYPYGLYCIIMATMADDQVASAVQEHRDELSKIAGRGCCLVYFRDIERAKLLEPFTFAEHAKGVMSLADVIGLSFNDLPCLLFFEDMLAGDYASISLDKVQMPAVIGRIRGIFAHLYSGKELTLSAVKTLKFSKKIGKVAQTAGKGVIGVGKEVLLDLLKSLVKIV